MHEDRVRIKLKRLKWRIIGGLCFAALCSSAVVVGFSTGYISLVYAGLVFIGIGLFYTTIGIIGYNKQQRKLSEGGPNFHIPCEIWKKDNSKPDSWYFLALEFLGQDLPKKAIEAFNRALELEPTFPTAWFGLSRAWRLLGNDGQVMETAKEGLKIDPLNTDGLLLFADACFSMGNRKLALNAVKTCLKINKKHVYAHQLLEQWEKME